MKVCTCKCYVIIQQYFKKFCKNNVIFESMANMAEIFQESQLSNQLYI